MVGTRQLYVTVLCPSLFGYTTAFYYYRVDNTTGRRRVEKIRVLAHCFFFFWVRVSRDSNCYALTRIEREHLRLSATDSSAHIENNNQQNRLRCSSDSQYSNNNKKK